MKEISCKKVHKSMEASIPEMPKESYPSFSIYEDAPEDLLKVKIGTELTAKIKLTSKDVHEGKEGRKSVGFDVISILAPEEKPKQAQNQGSQSWME